MVRTRSTASLISVRKWGRGGTRWNASSPKLGAASACFVSAVELVNLVRGAGIRCSQAYDIPSTHSSWLAHHLLPRFTMKIAKTFSRAGVMGIASLSILSTTHASTYFVAPNGADTNPGTLERPFASLSRAQKAARQSRGGEPIKVNLREGIYYLPEPLVFAPEDSGTKTARVTYQAYQKER